MQSTEKERIYTRKGMDCLDVVSACERAIKKAD